MTSNYGARSELKAGQLALVINTYKPSFILILDYILTCVWVILIIAGIVTQYFLTRTEKFPPLYKLKKNAKRQNRNGRRASNKTADERTPLLQGDNSIQYGVVLTPSKRSENNA